MCFTIKTRRKLKAKKDIICYKLVYEDLTPLYNFNDGFKYKLNKLENDKGKKDILRINKSVYEYPNIDIGFHSYKTKKMCKFVRIYIYNKNIIIECIIPKGAHYYVNNKEYVSDQIKPIKIIN